MIRRRTILLFWPPTCDHTWLFSLLYIREHSLIVYLRCLLWNEKFTVCFSLVGLFGLRSLFIDEFRLTWRCALRLFDRAMVHPRRDKLRGSKKSLSLLADISELFWWKWEKKKKWHETRFVSVATIAFQSGNPRVFVFLPRRRAVVQQTRAGRARGHGSACVIRSSRRNRNFFRVRKRAASSVFTRGAPLSRSADEPRRAAPLSCTTSFRECFHLTIGPRHFLFHSYIDLFTIIIIRCRCFFFSLNNKNLKLTLTRCMRRLFGRIFFL